MRLIRRFLRFRLRLRLHRSREMSSRPVRLAAVQEIQASQSSVEAVDVTLSDSLPSVDEDSAVGATDSRRRPGLPPALLLAVTPLRRLLRSHDFWLGAIVLIWVFAAIAIQ
jgi:hypothetical protein